MITFTTSTCKLCNIATAEGRFLCSKKKPEFVKVYTHRNTHLEFYAPGFMRQPTKLNYGLLYYCEWPNQDRFYSCPRIHIFGPGVFLPPGHGSCPGGKNTSVQNRRFWAEIKIPFWFELQGDFSSLSYMVLSTSGACYATADTKFSTATLRYSYLKIARSKSSHLVNFSRHPSAYSESRARKI